MDSQDGKHSLHHTKQMENMRQSFRKQCLSQSRSSQSSKSSPTGSDNLSSCQSYQTQPTEYSESCTRTAPKVHYRNFEPPRYLEDTPQQESPRSSVASTIQSAEDALEQPDYEVPDYTGGSHQRSTVLPATPSEFSDLFPSQRRLWIRHDDTTPDGNMNLRLDASVCTQSGRKIDMTLFHLRMHDLRMRDFSLRRYCRDSGREVCHSTRKEQKSTGSARPSIQRSLSNAISSMRPRSSSDRSPKTSLDLKRNDSGYGSLRSVEMDSDQRSSKKSGAKKSPLAPSNVIRLEFSNYAHVEVKPAGSKYSKRYEFEYWGVRYSWKRIVHREGQIKTVGFHLMKAGDEQVLGYIMPWTPTPVEVEEEQNKGGWIPPCSLWIADEGIVRAQKDVSDVIVAAGLIALVDDSIKARFHPKYSRQIHIPKLHMGVEVVGPKRFIHEMWKRNPSRPRSSSSRRPSTTETTTTAKRNHPPMVRQNSSHV